MFGATPMQKLQEILAKYPKSDAPKPSERRLDPGLKKQVTVTSEAVKPFGIPYNSTALQHWADSSENKKATAHIDPDFPQLISITIEGSTQVIDANLRMTALMGLTLSEMPEVIRDTVQRQPELRHIHDEHLREAVARRARGSGFFASGKQTGELDPARTP